jgi:hypothetical protein
MIIDAHTGLEVEEENGSKKDATEEIQWEDLIEELDLQIVPVEVPTTNVPARKHNKLLN